MQQFIPPFRGSVQNSSERGAAIVEQVVLIAGIVMLFAVLQLHFGVLRDRSAQAFVRAMETGGGSTETSGPCTGGDPSSLPTMCTLPESE
jgi:hypothetical protein